MKAADQPPENGQAEKKIPTPKRTGSLIKLTFLLITAICLMSIKMKQNEANTEPTSTTVVVTFLGKLIVISIVIWLIKKGWIRLQISWMKTAADHFPPGTIQYQPEPRSTEQNG